MAQGWMYAPVPCASRTSSTPPNNPLWVSGEELTDQHMRHIAACVRSLSIRKVIQWRWRISNCADWHTLPSLALPYGGDWGYWLILAEGDYCASKASNVSTGGAELQMFQL